VHVPRKAAWLQAFLDESSAFPVGKTDDRVDAFCYATAWLRDRCMNSLPSGEKSVIQAVGKPIVSGSDIRRALDGNRGSFSDGEPPTGGFSSGILNKVL
jgi:hypothetical protein